MAMKTRALCCLLVALFLFSLVSTAAGQAKSNYLVIAIGGDVESLDPHWTINTLTIMVTDQIYEPLLITDVDMQLQPRLATSYKRVDPLTWELYLRKGVSFHCGEPFTAQAVKTTLERALDPASPGSGLLSMISSVSVKDPYTVVIKTKEPFTPLPYHLAHSGAIMMCPKCLAKWGRDIAGHPCGTGQFRLTEWVRGDKVSLVRNEHYYLGGHLDRVIFRTIPDEITRLIAIETGEVDIVMDIPPTEVKALDAHPDIKVMMKPGTATICINMNARKAPFDDIRVRQAFQYAVNDEEIVRHVLEGLGEAATVPFAPAIWGSAQGKIRMYQYDLAKAKGLLAAAGWKDTDGDGFVDKSGQRLRVTLHTPEGRYLRDREIAQAVQAQLRAIGVDAQLRTWEWGGYMTSMRNHELDMFMSGLGVSTADMDYGMGLATYSKGSYNFHEYLNPRVDELFLAARGEVDAKKRLDLYYEAQRLVMTDAQVIPINHMVVMAAVNERRVQGFEPQAGNRVRLLDVKCVR